MSVAYQQSTVEWTCSNGWFKGENETAMSYWWRGFAKWSWRTEARAKRRIKRRLYN